MYRFNNFDGSSILFSKENKLYFNNPEDFKVAIDSVDKTDEVQKLKIEGKDVDGKLTEKDINAIKDKVNTIRNDLGSVPDNLIEKTLDQINDAENLTAIGKIIQIAFERSQKNPETSNQSTKEKPAEVENESEKADTSIDFSVLRNPDEAGRITVSQELKAIITAKNNKFAADFIKDFQNADLDSDFINLLYTNLNNSDYKNHSYEEIKSDLEIDYVNHQQKEYDQTLTKQVEGSTVAKFLFGGKEGFVNALKDNNILAKLVALISGIDAGNSPLDNYKNQHESELLSIFKENFSKKPAKLSEPGSMKYAELLNKPEKDKYDNANVAILNDVTNRFGSVADFKPATEKGRGSLTMNLNSKKEAMNFQAFYSDTLSGSGMDIFSGFQDKFAATDEINKDTVKDMAKDAKNAFDNDMFASQKQGLPQSMDVKMNGKQVTLSWHPDPSYTSIFEKFSKNKSEENNPDSKKDKEAQDAKVAEQSRQANTQSSASKEAA